MKSCAPASFAAVITRSIEMAGSASAMLSRTERLNRTFSCNTTPICRRSQAVSTMARSVPSTRTRPLDQLGESALARTRRTNDADDLAGIDLERNIMQHFGTIDPIAEGSMLESDCSAYRRERRPRRIEARLG